MTLQEIVQDTGGGPLDLRSAAGQPHLRPATHAGDSMLELFIRTALSEQDAHQALKGFYTDVLHRTLLMQLAGLRDLDEAAKRGRVKPLPKWRLKRVCDFVEANLENRLSLRLLAQAAGVSRMYFAAQFRAATGASPHAYALQRRLARAEIMLAETNDGIVDIALSVGFQTQSHFTTVFKSAKGMTPNRWRALHAGRISESIARDDAPTAAQLCISEMPAAFRKDAPHQQTR